MFFISIENENRCIDIPNIYATVYCCICVKTCTSLWNAKSSESGGKFCTSGIMKYINTTAIASTISTISVNFHLNFFTSFVSFAFFAIFYILHKLCVQITLFSRHLDSRIQT